MKRLYIFLLLFALVATAGATDFNDLIGIDPQLRTFFGDTSNTEIGYVNGVTGGTAAAGKAVVLDSSSNLNSGINDFTVDSNLLFGANTITTNSAVLGATRTDIYNSSVGLDSTLTILGGALYTITQTDAGTAGHTVDFGAGTVDGTYNTATFDAENEALIFYGIANGVGVSLYNSAALGN